MCSVEAYICLTSRQQARGEPTHSSRDVVDVSIQADVCRKNIHVTEPRWQCLRYTHLLSGSQHITDSDWFKCPHFKLLRKTNGSRNADFRGQSQLRYSPITSPGDRFLQSTATVSPPASTKSLQWKGCAPREVTNIMFRDRPHTLNVSQAKQKSLSGESRIGSFDNHHFSDSPIFFCLANEVRLR